MRRLLLLAPLALAGCAAGGAGWNRASDLSIYSSAHAYARVAWEQDVLCEGSDRARVSAGFEREFGARDAAVRQALAARHGEAALARSAPGHVQRVPCGDIPDPQWRARYARLLRLLEIRLGLS